MLVQRIIHNTDRLFIGIYFPKYSTGMVLSSSHSGETKLCGEEGCLESSYLRRSWRCGTSKLIHLERDKSAGDQTKVLQSFAWYVLQIVSAAEIFKNLVCIPTDLISSQVSVPVLVQYYRQVLYSSTCKRCFLTGIAPYFAKGSTRQCGGNTL